MSTPDTTAILVLNAGSSSLKTAVFAASGDADAAWMTADVEEIGGAARMRVDGGARVSVEAPTHEAAVSLVTDAVRARGVDLVAAGHRVVHGGKAFSAPTRITPDVEAAIERLTPLARTHNPYNLAGIRAVSAVWPDVPQVACFDTAFHRTMPEVARTFALPKVVREQSVERYGFHGLSYAWIASRLPDVDPRAATGRTIVAHLGNGASMCALKACRSIATSMGMTPLDGLMMGTRPGLLDPGVVLFMQSELGMGLAEIEQALFRESGLLGVSGVSNDMRELLASDAADARKAVVLFQYNAIRMMGSLAAALGGLDAIVFTGGIGEHAAPVREGIMNGCRWLGVVPDDDRNRSARQDVLTISAQGSTVQVHVIPTNEEAVIARDTRAVLGL